MSPPAEGELPVSRGAPARGQDSLPLLFEGERRTRRSTFRSSRHPSFQPFFTGSSFAHGIFRYFSLKERELYLLDNQTGGRKTSKMELEWLEYESFKRNIYIRHAFNHKGGQKKVGNYFLDGYHVKSNTAYEFLGGCCATSCRANPLSSIA